MSARDRTRRTDAAVRSYLVVLETDGLKAPVHIMDSVEAYFAYEASTQLLLETVGLYGCEARTIFLRPDTPLSATIAVQLIAARALVAMPNAPNAGKAGPS